MKKIKQRIIYDNYYSEHQYNYAKDFLIEEHLDENPDDKDWQPSDQDVWDEIYFVNDINWDNFKNEFEEFMNGHTFILQGEIGTWMGQMAGGFTFDSFNELSKAWKHCDYIKVYDENGHFYIECSHHDGTNFYEVRKLSKKGEEYLNNHYYDDKRELHNKLMKNPYSVLPNYAHEVYGCNKIEYEYTE